MPMTETEVKELAAELLKSSIAAGSQLDHVTEAKNAILQAKEFSKQWNDPKRQNQERGNQQVWHHRTDP